MDWQHPEWLYLLLPLAAAWLLLSLYSRRKRRTAAAAFVAPAMWARILPVDSAMRFFIKLALQELALVLGLIALAGPRFGEQFEDVIPKGSDLYVLIDVSRSMLAEDVPPSRLGRAKADVAALVNRLEGERVGLIAFAGQAVVKCPLTVDYDAFRRSLDELDPGSAPRGGTAIGDAIRKALEVFHARTDRDQAILLITDGDDQQSYPLEAAEVAAERHVTIFTVGLGDADHGARIPRAGESKSYLEYQGQQVWTKLDGSLLKDIALKTAGVYVPVGTKAYDLGELYAKYLQGRRSGDEQAQKRIRRADQFQIFLALALLALLADAFIRPYPSAKKVVTASSASAVRTRTPLPVSAAVATLVVLAGIAGADDPMAAVRDGLSWYGKGDFDKARERFAAAREQFDTADAARAAVAAFDQACAAHKKGDVAQAREWYLKAGLAHDKDLAASAHYNLGTLAAEEARRLAGEHPEDVPPEKRNEILEQVKSAVASLRHCLELQPQNARARKDIELLRQWTKYYSDRWQAADREKRRKETNLVAFVEYLIETQRAIRESVKSLPPTAPADAFADPRRIQDELREEIPTLNQKIRDELMPPQSPAPGAPAPTNTREIEQGITMLQGWSESAGEKMSSASRQLDARQPAPAAADQQAAIEELEKIWDAVIPFHPLLARDLTDQTAITKTLEPPPAADDKEKPPANPQSPLATESELIAPLTEIQERTLKRTKLLELKAKAELARVDQAAGAEKEKPPASNKKDDPAKDDPNATPPVDPKELKAGYQKAIELAPKAAERMDQAVKSLKKKDAVAAYPPAEEARKILEEIQKAQPRQKQEDQKKEDQQKQDQKKKDDQQKQDQQKNDQQKKDQDQQKKSEDQQKKGEDQQKKDAEKKDEDQQKKDQGQDEQKSKNAEKPSEKVEQKDQPEPQVSRDRIEEALRKVRERQQEKRERDRQMKARVLGRTPVEKDW